MIGKLREHWNYLTSNPISKYYISLDGSKLIKSWRGGSLSIDAAEIGSIVAHKLNKATYDELFLTFRNDNKVIQIGQLDHFLSASGKFRDVATWMHKWFPSIEANWEEQLNHNDDSASIQLLLRER